MDNDRVLMKTFTSTTIFTYELKIETSKKSPSDLLYVQSALMSTIGDSYVNNRKKTHNLEYFEYKHIKEFRSGLVDLGNCWNVVTY